MIKQAALMGIDEMNPVFHWICDTTVEKLVAFPGTNA